MFNWFKKIFSWFRKAEVKEVIEGLVEKIPVKEETVAREYPHGRLIEWFTPQGKRVVCHEDGTFESGHWESEAKKSWAGICCLYKNKFPESKIDQCEIEGTETKVHNFITAFNPHGTYLDTGESAKVPNGIQHYIRCRYTDSGDFAPYYIEFEYNNERDAIISLGGFYVIGGPEGHVQTPAQKRHAHDCNGHRTYLR